MRTELRQLSRGRLTLYRLWSAGVIDIADLQPMLSASYATTKKIRAGCRIDWDGAQYDAAIHAATATA